MNVLVIGLYYPPHHFGGYELSCADVVDRLEARGHRVTVLTSTLRRDDVTDPPGERPRVRRDLTAYFGDGALWQPGPVGRWRVERRNQAALARALDEVRPDVVSAWQLGALSLGLLTTVIERGIPLVLSVCDDWLSYGLELDPWVRSWRRHRRAGRALRPLLGVPTVPPPLDRHAAACFVTDDTRVRAERYSPWRFPRSAVVWSGIDLAEFPARPDAATDAWRGRLLYVGRYDARKGIETVVRALAALPDAVLEVLGTGDAGERDRLAAVAAELGVADRVELGHGVDRGEVARRYAAADAVVFPSEWEEPFGLVPVEAMAVGTPVLATGVGGSGRFLVDGANCLLFSAGDPAALAAATTRLAGDVDLRRRLVAGGRTTAAFFDIEHLADAFEAWHAYAAGGLAGPPPPERGFSL